MENIEIKYIRNKYRITWKVDTLITGVVSGKRY
jgi:hypothetical protein